MLKQFKMYTSFFLFFANLLIALSFGHKKKGNNDLITVNKEFSTLRKLNIEDPVLIGFDTFHKNDKNFTFNTYLLFPEEYHETKPKNLSLALNIIHGSRLRALDDMRDAFCEIDNDEAHSNEKINTYYCYANYSRKIVQVYLRNDNINDLNITFSFLANLLKNNIQNEKSSFLFNVSQIKTLNQTEIIKSSPLDFRIRGKGLNESDISNNIKLIIINYKNVRLDIPCKGEINEEKYYILQCSSPLTLNTDLNNTYGIFENDNSKLFKVEFPNGNSTSMIENYDFHAQKKTSGMSTGGIIAITIPCLIILIGILGLALALKGKNPNPPLKDLVNNNNTVGINGTGSSQEVVHK